MESPERVTRLNQKNQGPRLTRLELLASGDAWGPGIDAVSKNPEERRVSGRGKDGCGRPRAGHLEGTDDAAVLLSIRGGRRGCIGWGRPGRRNGTGLGRPARHRPHHRLEPQDKEPGPRSGPRQFDIYL